MKFHLTISTDNAAFGEPVEDTRHGVGQERALETARILRQVADRVESGDIEDMFRTIYDINGNDVGRAAFKRDDYR